MATFPIAFDVLGLKQSVLLLSVVVGLRFCIQGRPHAMQLHVLHTANLVLKKKNKGLGSTRKDRVYPHHKNENEQDHNNTHPRTSRKKSHADNKSRRRW